MTFCLQLTSTPHSALCLLDLTAAFDTVDHDLVMLKLERQFGLRSVVLDWFRSYLCGRMYRVIHCGKTSYIVHVICSVPQGSVLGPRNHVCLFYTQQTLMMWPRNIA